MPNSKISGLTAGNAGVNSDLLPVARSGANRSLKLGQCGLSFCLGKSGAAVSAAADTNENVLATITVPAGVLGANGVLRLKCTFTHTSSANNKTLRARYSAIGGTDTLNTIATTTTANAFEVTIANRNGTGSQHFTTRRDGTAASLVSNLGTLSVDTTVATTLLITGQKATAGETLTLESYLCELIADTT